VRVLGTYRRSTGISRVLLQMRWWPPGYSTPETRMRDVRRREQVAILFASLVLLLLAACTRPPAPIPPTAAIAPTPHCFALVLQVDGVDHDGRICAAEVDWCGRARAAAMQLGWMAGVVSVGACEEEGR